MEHSHALFVRSDRDGRDSVHFADDIMGRWAARAAYGTNSCRAIEEVRRWRRETTDSLAVGKRIMRTLSGLSDKELEDTFDGLGNDEWQSIGPDLCLAEMIHRGGQHWEKVIQARIDKPPAGDSNAATKPAVNKPVVIHNVILLTALCRVQKKDDPLPILVEGTSEIRFHIGDAR